MIERNLYMNRFVRIEDVWSQWDLFTNSFSPDWVVTKAMSAFLGRESCTIPRVIDGEVCLQMAHFLLEHTLVVVCGSIRGTHRLFK